MIDPETATSEEKAIHARKVGVNPDQVPCPSCGHTEWYKYYGNACHCMCSDKYHAKWSLPYGQFEMPKARRV